MTCIICGCCVVADGDYPDFWECPDCRLIEKHKKEVEMEELNWIYK